MNVFCLQRLTDVKTQPFLAMSIILLSWAGSSYAQEGSATASTDDTLSNLSNAGYTKQGSLIDLIKIRCATDGQDVWTLWTGEVYSYVPQERQKKLFKVVGANVARCKQQKDGTWYFTSREVQYYLDPKTGQRLDHWINPWTKEKVPVMHVANELVQGKFRSAPKLTLYLPFATLRMPINLLYPNRLSKDPELKAYSPESMYQAGEFFGLLSPISDLKDPKKSSAAMSLTWTRVGPWLPWMAMGNRPGFLVYSADGGKVNSFEDLPQWLKQEIKENIPLYSSAPRCYLKSRNTSSWTYFARHKSAYVAGQRFPLPAPIKTEICQDELDSPQKPRSAP